MRHIALILAAAAAALAGCATPVQDPGAGGMAFPPEIAARCRAEGGCAVVSRLALQQGMAQAYELGEAAAGCRRDAL